MPGPEFGKHARAAGRVACRTVAWTSVGAVLGGAAGGVFGILYGLLWAALHGAAGFPLSAVGGLMLAGTAAGALTGAVAALDGHNPLSRDQPPKQTASAPKNLRPRVRVPVLPEAARARLDTFRPPVDR